MRPVIELPPRRINHMRTDRHEQRRNRVESVIALIGALAFCWWLGGRIHAAVMAGSPPFVHAAERLAEIVSGK